MKICFGHEFITPRFKVTTSKSTAGSSGVRTDRGVATAKATAAKSGAKGGRNFVKAAPVVNDSVGRSKPEMDKFRRNLKSSPDEIKTAWEAVFNLPKGDAKREEVFDAIMNVHKGNWDQVKMSIEKSWERSTGTSPCCLRLMMLRTIG